MATRNSVSASQSCCLHFEISGTIEADFDELFLKCGLLKAKEFTISSEM